MLILYCIILYYSIIRIEASFIDCVLENVEIALLDTKKPLILC